LAKSAEIKNMNWKQLIVSKKNKSDFEFLQIQFKFNQAILYTVLADNNMKVIASPIGLTNEIELKKC